MRSRFGRPALLAAALILSALALDACATGDPLSADFGVAVRQDLAAQIANPDAHYVGDPAPGSSGARVALAQERYQTGKTIPPASADASGVGVQGASTAATPSP